MAGNSLKNEDRIRHRFQTLLLERLPQLTAANCINVHIDELFDKNLSSQQMIDYSEYLFKLIMSDYDNVLVHKIAMLAIPLCNSSTLDTSPPLWTTLGSQLSRTPPSIYVISVPAYLQTDRAQRYIALGDTTVFGDNKFISTYYQCWRNTDDPKEEGWSRDVRVVYTAFIKDII